MQRSILIIDPDAGSAQTTQVGIMRGIPNVLATVAVQPEGSWPALADRDPDVLIIDPSPHSLSGVNLIQRLRERSPEVAIVVLASKPTPALRQIARELGVDVYLEKPMALPSLLAHLEQLLERLRLPPVATPVEYPAVS